MVGQRKVTATLFVTLDGVIEDPHKWSFAYWGEETAKFKLDELHATDALLLGRTTYEGFAAAWPGRKDPDGFADKFNSMPKYVVSTTMKKPEWENSHVLGPDLAREIGKLKAQGGGDIGVHGSASVVRWLLQHDLLDELRILLYPIVLGEGKRLFDDATQAKLALVESTAFKTGVVALIYHRAQDAPAEKKRPYADLEPARARKGT